MEPLKEMCAAAGVVVAFVPEPPKIRTSGATRWLKPDKALIQLSLRFKWANSIWFTFFHEAGHIVLHGKKDVFLEDGERTVHEEEADRFARDILIPPNELDRFVRTTSLTASTIQSFAKSIGVHPCIVVGRLQYDKRLPFHALTDLKPRFIWKQTAAN
jgi:hypothetical protein